MVNITINNRSLSVAKDTTILDAAREVGIAIPTLCFLKEINEIAACRVCVVELEGSSQLVTACNTPCKEGMVLYTNSPRVREARRMNVELILSQHDARCASCIRSQNCSLQTLSNDLGITNAYFSENIPANHWNSEFPLIREESKCIKCMRCVQICDKVQSLGVWDVVNSGARTTVGTHNHGKIEHSNCSLCGQCITHCPTGALHERDDTWKVFEALADPEKITMVQIAPAVRTAWGEELNLSPEEATVEKMGAILKELGFDYVFDTTFSADLTIMEEGSEFLSFMADHQEHDLPMFTSCCPGWVRFVKSEYPQLVTRLSTAKSPQQMFGAVTKSWLAEYLGIDPHKIFSLSIMPCVAKKYECDLPTMVDACQDPDVDLSITTRELNRLIRADHICVESVEPQKLDDPLGIGTGAGVIFGTTGGVMEAALRSAYFLVMGENPPADAFERVRGEEVGSHGWQEALFDLDGTKIRVAVVNGLGNTRHLLEDVLAQRKHYDFVEVMACPGGCVGGGGQPIHDQHELADTRKRTLFSLDENATLRFSHENPSVQFVYENYFEKPLSERSHHLLHTSHE